MAVTVTIASKPPIKIYRFGPTSEGSASMKDVLGGKGANLAEMSSLGVPVPPGFTIPCSASVQFKEVKNSAPAASAFFTSLWAEVAAGIEYLKESNGYLPLVSVRSGARVSMPGMMDTILNVGLTSSNVEEWASKIGERAAFDSYRRLIQMYSSVALGVPMEKFEEILADARKEAGVKTDSELSADYLRRTVTRYLKMVSGLGMEFPDTFEDQLNGAILAVFKSWDNPRAIEYRKINSIPDEWGTAVNVQSMVFGNFNDQSATGVLFTRDPASGENCIVGEFLINAQGEDVVAGIRTPQPLADMVEWNQSILDSLVEYVSMLEEHYRDMQDVEFTIQDGKLYLLQTRNGKRSAQAAFKIAYDMVQEGMITAKESSGRITQRQLFAVMQDSIDPKFNVKPDLIGIAAGGGLATGVAVFSSDDAVNCTEPCILVTPETDPDDIAGMNAAVGILTATGGMTSHAAVVARGMNKSCVVGATELIVEGNYAHTANSITVNKFTKVTIDGSTGSVWFATQVPVIPGGSSPEVKALIGWAMEDLSGISDRIDLTNAMDSEEILQAVTSSVCSSIYVDTAMLESINSMNLDKLKLSMNHLRVALTASAAQEIVVDLTTMDDHLSAPDVVFNSIFGLSKDHDQHILIAKVSSMVDWASSLKEKIMVKIPPDADPVVTNRLTKAGFKITGFISTVADLLNASGPVQVSEAVLKNVFGGAEAYKALCAMIESNTGNALTGVLGVPVYWYDFLNKEEN